ncbi:MAG: sulfatase-like hydrolase/transferase, partial [Planctomycetes bacterium]|nr:sulfatase-like hydrolase/transferase [Planctomycetota bacterium]
MKLSQRSSWGLGWLAVGLCALPGPSCGSPEKAKLDLILVSVDTLRVDRLGIYGSERAPEGRDTSRVGSLPWLAANSTTWTQAWAPAGKTVPSLGTFFTGLEPLEHGAFSHLTPIQAPSMVSALQEEGYRTFGRVANRLLGTPLGFDRGFENYAIRPRRMEVQIPEELLDLTKGPIESGEPVLAWAHFMAPHQPYEPPPQFDRWSDSDRPVKADNSLLNRIHQSPQFLTPGQREDIRAKYDGEIAFAASMVESLLAGLDAQYRAAGRGPLLENALVVFFS